MMPETRTPSAPPTPQGLPHSLAEDALALVIGTLFLALGLSILAKGGLGLGGVAGLSFLLQTATGVPFGVGFFLLSLPFLVFAQLACGTAYVVRTLLASAMLAAEVLLLPRVLTVAHVDPVVAAIIGGLLCGMGMLALVRHNTGMGGVAILAVWLQKRFGWRAGKLLLAADLAVVLLAFAVLSPGQVLLSVLAVTALNLVLALYHRPGRYLGF